MPFGGGRGSKLSLQVVELYPFPARVQGRGPAAPPPYLFAAGVEALLHLLPGLGHVALLHQGKVMGVLEADLQLAVLRLLQGVQEILGEPPWRGEEGALLGGPSSAQRLQAGESPEPGPGPPP